MKKRNIGTFDRDVVYMWYCSFVLFLFFILFIARTFPRHFGRIGRQNLVLLISFGFVIQFAYGGETSRRWDTFSLDRQLVTSPSPIVGTFWLSTVDHGQL